MQLSLKVAATMVIVVASFGVLDRFLHWMNQPSDLKLYSGLLGALGLLVFTPATLAAIWSWGKGRRNLAHDDD